MTRTEIIEKIRKDFGSSRDGYIEYLENRLAEFLEPAFRGVSLLCGQRVRIKSMDEFTPELQSWWNKYSCGDMVGALGQEGVIVDINPDYGSPEAFYIRTGDSDMHSWYYCREMFEII